MIERWRQLPLDHALSCSGRVRAFVQSLADAVAMGAAREDGVPASAVPVVPDLGPATLMDQLTVMVHDASAAALISTLAEDLASLRRELR